MKTYCVPALIGGGAGPEAGRVGFRLGVVGSCWHASVEQGHRGPQMLEAGTWDPMCPEAAILARGTGGTGAGSRKGRHSKAPSAGRGGWWAGRDLGAPIHGWDVGSGKIQGSRVVSLQAGGRGRSEAPLIWQEDGFLNLQFLQAFGEALWDLGDTEPGAYGAELWPGTLSLG